MNGDPGLFRLINDWAEDVAWPHAVVRVYANDGVLLFGLLLLIAWWRARRAGDLERAVRAVLASAGTLLALAVNQPIVQAVNERRPYAALQHVTLLVHRSTDPSFPSDHANMAGAVAVGLLLTSWRLGLVASVLAGLMALSRVYVGAHYPIDVGVGLEVGGVVAAVVQLLTPAVLPIAAKLTRTRLRALLTATRG